MTSAGEMRSTAGGRLLREVVVVSSLSELVGPLEGVHRLPLHLDRSAPASYDFADPQWRSIAYRIILAEALSQDDLRTWLNSDALVEAWSDLYLPRHVRRAWEDKHVELAARGAGPNVPAA